MKDDTISRQAAIDVFGDVHPLDYNAQTYLDKIKALPTIEPERKKGRWVFEHYPGYFTWTSTGIKLWPVCSECRTEHPVTNFCANCGADMREGAEQDD